MQRPGPVPGFPPSVAPQPDSPPTWQAAAPAPPVPPPPARTGAFADVRARWLAAWALGGALLVSGLSALIAARTDVVVTDELVTALMYAPIAAWVLVMVVGRARIDLTAMLRWPRLGRYWAVVAGMFVVQFLFSLGASTLTSWIAPGLDDSLEGIGQGSLIVALVGIVVLPPLVEETVFRGVLIERFAVKWSLPVAILISAVMFGVLHADPVGAGMFGVITALVYVRTGSLWPGILLHFTNNLTALVAMRASGTSTQAPPADLASALATAGFFLLFSVPFLMWFLWTHWPRSGQLTPYQGFELTRGLPERVVEPVAWSGAPGVARLAASATQLAVTPLGATVPLALLPVEQVARTHTTGIPGGEQVVVQLWDGSWTTLRPVDARPGRAEALARVITERSEQADYRLRMGMDVPGPPASPTVG